LYEFPNIETKGIITEKNMIENFKHLFKDPEMVVVLDQFKAKHLLTHQTIFARFWHLSGKPSNIVTKNKRYIEIKISQLPQYPVHRLMHKYLVDMGLD
jgi:hypothetical protein